ncbi:MAG: aldo/keto reductase [Solirubrobacteraceae bacterium]
MDRTELGPLGVSRLCLGTMLMGRKTPPDESHRMLDRYLEAGGNFIDTADVYGDGDSERTLAPWLAQHRDEVVVATKVRMPVSDPPGQGLAPERVRAACVPWGPLGAGFLTGKYARDTEPPAGSRMAEAGDEIEEARHRRAIERNFRVVDEAEAIARETGASISQVALAWLLGVEGVVAPIVGPRTFEQLEDLLGAAGLSLTGEQRSRLEAHAPPPPMYPQRMLAEQVGLGELARLRRLQRREQALEI